MCIINSCQPDIKICFFSLLPLFPQALTSHKHGTCSIPVISGLLRRAPRWAVILRSHGVFASHQPLSPRGMEGAYVGGAQAAEHGWAFPGGGEGFIIGIVGTERCRRGHYEDPWRLPAGEHGCREKKRTEESFGFMRAWV